MRKKVISISFVILLVIICAVYGQSGNDKKYFSDEELCQMARSYYAEHHDGFAPPNIEIDSHTTDGKVRIHLYENLEDHQATYDWYTVDRSTGIGEDLNAHEIHLSESY